MNNDKVITGLKNCSGSGENCHCPYSDNVAGSCVSALCQDALKLIKTLLQKIEHAEGEAPAGEG